MTLPWPNSRRYLLLALLALLALLVLAGCGIFDGTFLGPMLGRKLVPNAGAVCQYHYECWWYYGWPGFSYCDFVC